jgi:soluble lytic murein transglycosylase-like protein
VPYADLFTQAGAKHGVSPALLAAVAKTESNFNSSAVSPAGAEGLMQFMPATARGLGVDADDPASAIDGAARYLSSLTEQFGSTDLALAAYNAGPGTVRRHGGIPPYPETQDYVRKVTSAAEGWS